MGQIELKVEDGGAVILSYTFQNIRAATEMFVYLRDFFPSGRFIMQPVVH